MTASRVPTVEISATYRGVHKRFLTLAAAWRDIARAEMKQGHEHIDMDYDGYVGRECHCDWCNYIYGKTPNAWKERVRQLKAEDRMCRITPRREGAS